MEFEASILLLIFELLLLTAVDVGVSILVHIVRHGALDVGKTRRLYRQNLEIEGLN